MMLEIARDLFGAHRSESKNESEEANAKTRTKNENEEAKAKTIKEVTVPSHTPIGRRIFPV